MHASLSLYAFTDGPSRTALYSVSQKSIPWGFLTFFPKRLGIFSPNFTRLLYVPIYARLQIFIQLPQLWWSYAILSVTTQFTSYAQCPSSAETHTFRCLRKTSIAFICWSLSVASHHRSAAVHFLALWWSLALTEVCEMLEELHTTHGSRVG